MKKLNSLEPQKVFGFFEEITQIPHGSYNLDGINKYLVDFAGAGATVPISGFGYLLAKGVRDAVTADGLIGALTGGLEACAGGVTAAVLFALIVAVMFNRGDKTAKIMG